MFTPTTVSFSLDLVTYYITWSFIFETIQPLGRLSVHTKLNSWTEKLTLDLILKQVGKPKNIKKWNWNLSKHENKFPASFLFFAFLTTLFVTDFAWLRRNSSEQVCETEWICYLKFLFFLTRFAIRNGFVQ